MTETIIVLEYADGEVVYTAEFEVMAAAKAYIHDVVEGWRNEQYAVRAHVSQGMWTAEMCGAGVAPRMLILARRIGLTGKVLL